MAGPLRSRREGAATVADPLVPPHSVEAEQAVLGGLLIDPQAWDQVADLVREEDFYRPDHALIFGTLAQLAEASRPLDMVTVAEQLERNSKLGDAGGMAYLGTLARDTPTAANVRAYAQIVRERSLLRKLVSAGREIASSVFAGDGATARDLEIDTCTRCGGALKIIASIEEPEVIARILAHLERTVPEQRQSELPLGARAPPMPSRLL